MLPSLSCCLPSPSSPPSSSCLLAFTFTSATHSSRERTTTTTLDLWPLCRRAVVLVSAVVLAALAPSVVLVPLVILPAVILILSLALTIFALFLDSATIALVAVTLPSLLSPLFILSPLLSFLALCMPCGGTGVAPNGPSETEDRRVRLRAGGRQDHRVACERRAVPIW